MILDYESAMAQAVVNLQLWRLGALERVPPELLEAFACELAATLDYAGELIAQRRAARLRELH